MSADSKCSYGSSSFPTTKIQRIGDAIVGTAGTTGAGNKFVKWLEAARAAPADEIPDPPKMGKDDDWEALVLTPSGLFLYPGEFEPVEIKREFHTIGSGGQAAELAMLKYGRDPAGAVEDACAVDNASGGPVLTLRLDANP